MIEEYTAQSGGDCPFTGYSFTTVTCPETVDAPYEREDLASTGGDRARNGR